VPLWLSQSFDQTKAASYEFFVVQGGKAVSAVKDTGEGLYAVATSSEARTAFMETYDKTAVQPLANRIVGKAELRNIKDPGYLTFSGLVAEDLIGAPAAEGIVGHDLGTGEKLPGELFDLGERTQRLANGVAGAASTAGFIEISVAKLTPLGPKMFPPKVAPSPAAVGQTTPEPSPSNAPKGVTMAQNAGLTNSADLVRQYAPRVTPVEGFTDVFIHGTGDAFAVLRNGQWVTISHRSLATYLRNQGITGNVRLISCNAGAGSAGQNLANQLGATVRAPTNTITVHPNGMLTAPSGTVWQDFTPGVRP
jgi:hypothetical protein